MSPEEFDWHLKLIQERYARSTLSQKQAEKVWEFENPPFIIPQKHYFSSWEELDYELYVFKKILTQKQFSLYKKDHEIRVRNLEKSYKKGDANYVKQVEYQQAFLEYSRTHFWPDLYNDYFLFRSSEFQWYHLEINYLKAAYKNYLQNLRIELLSQHFREFRQTQPTLLALTMLRYESYHLWPDFFSLEPTLNEPGKSAANYLIQKKIRFPDETENLIAKKIADLQKFTAAQNKKYFKDQGGWMITIGENWDEFEKRKQIIMPLLLADKNEYGWKSQI